MTTLTAPILPSLTCADAAAVNRAGNLAALSRTQPAVARIVESITQDHTWLLGRDGALTAMGADGQWITGCSLPRRAADAMLESLEAKVGAVCFLEPTHAAQVRSALDRLQPNQPILAIVREPADLAFILCGDDFTRELAHGRLWFATGPGWPDQLRSVLADHEGLPAATSFIRLPITPDDVAQERMEMAREVFAADSNRRSARIIDLKAAADTRIRDRFNQRICVAVPGLFRVEDDAGWLLRRALIGDDAADERFFHFDPDVPTAASPVALARVAAKADAIVTANVFRTDVQDVVSAKVPWLTWVTSPRIGPFRADCIADRLLLADESFHDPARAAGWPIDRLRLATWPQPAVPTPPGEWFVLIANTRNYTTPPAEFELSSHQLLWELIASELSRDALNIGRDLNGYITARMNRLGIAEEGLDRRMFIEQLIQPAYEQAVARALIHHRLPLRLYGHGWQSIDGFAEHALGPVANRQALLQAVAEARVLVHASPIGFAHWIDGLGRPVLRTAGLGEAALGRSAQAMLSPKSKVALPSLTPLSRALILDLTRVV